VPISKKVPGEKILAKASEKLDEIPVPRLLATRPRCKEAAVP